MGQKPSPLGESFRVLRSGKEWQLCDPIFLGGTNTGPENGFFGMQPVFGPVAVCVVQEERTIRNRVRSCGLLDEIEHPDGHAIEHFALTPNGQSVLPDATGLETSIGFGF